MYVQRSPETKAQAIELHNAGRTVAAISKELSISESTIRNWLLRYASPEEIAEEQCAQEISRLTVEYSRLMNIIESRV